MTLIKQISSVFAAAVMAVSATAWSYDVSSPDAVFIVNYTDAAGFGFNDPTLGSARKTALEYALSLWSAKLKGVQPIIVNAKCQNLGGTLTGAVLASAGPETAFASSNAAVFPHTYTFYPVGLFNQYAHGDAHPGFPDINVNVNVDVDNSTVLGPMNFYYGTDGNAGGHVDFVSVMLHELGHGLGFLSFMSPSGELANGLPDVYTRNLILQPSGQSLINMTDAGRQAAATSNAVFWDGSSLKNRYNHNTSEPYGHVKMYAPATYSSGSSISHFDLSNFPDLLMEPQYSGPDHGMDVTGNVLRDIGWFVDATALPVSLSEFTTE